MGMKIGQGILQPLIKIIGQLKLHENEVAQSMLKWQLRSGLADMLIFFSIPEPEYAYKRYAYKKKHVLLIIFVTFL